MYKLKKQLLLILIVTFSLPVITNAELPEFFDQPDSVYTSNVVTDMLVHSGAIWFATDEGLNFSTDGGDSWYLYDESNGLISSSISAFASVMSPFGVGQRIWTATNHEENIGGVNVAISDGVSYSDDNGLTWIQIDFETAPNDIPFVWGGDRTIFDITAHYDPNNPDLDNWVFFTAFAGGFLASRDGGDTWKRIFPSSVDSAQFYLTDAQPSLKNRYFSCVADTSHGDSLFVWAGSAGGFFQYVFAEPKDKPYTKHVTAIELCNECPPDDSNYVFYGGTEAFTRGNKHNGIALSKFVADGLLGGQITALLQFGGTLFIGTATSDNISTGLVTSTDFGENFITYVDPTNLVDTFFVGANNKISGFTVLNDRIFMAVEENGLFVSNDTGANWTHIDVDPLDVTPANRRNVVHALEAFGDTLNIGTDSGLVRLYYSPSGTVDSSMFFVYPENDTSSTKVINLHTQVFGSPDSTRLWTVNVPLDTTLNLNTPIVTYFLNNDTTKFASYRFNSYPSDVSSIGATAIMVGEFGAMRLDSTGPVTESYPIYERFISAIDTLTFDTLFIDLDSLNADTLTAISIKGDTIVVGSRKGFAVSTNGGVSFNITRVNTELLAPDVVLNITSAIDGIDGDWVPALGVQYETTDLFARLWASLRPTFSGAPGISTGFTTDVVIGVDTLKNQRVWRRVHDEFAWNFAFAGDTVFAATNAGLIYGISDSLVFGSFEYDWTTVELTDSLGAPLLLEGTAVYAVEVDDNYVWVGTGDRSVRLNRGNLDLSKAFFVEDPSDEVYAFPTPFSHANSNALDFHFVVNEQTNVTLEIYDFAMHLVRRVIDNVSYTPGIYPTAGTERRTWDGLNGNGEEAAVGMYYFKITYSTGEVHWGKIALIP